MANKDPGSWLLRWLVLAVALLPGAVAQATTYYLDCSAGSDSNTGTTPSAPWLTLGYAAQTV